MQLYVLPLAPWEISQSLLPCYIRQRFSENHGAEFDSFCSNTTRTARLSGIQFLDFVQYLINVSRRNKNVFSTLIGRYLL